MFIVENLTNTGKYIENDHLQSQPQITTIHTEYIPAFFINMHDLSLLPLHNWNHTLNRSTTYFSHFNNIS